MNNKIITLALLAVLCGSCQNSDDEAGDNGAATTELYTSEWLDMENGHASGFGTVPAKHTHSDITLAITGDKAKLGIESDVRQGSEQWHENVTATGIGASSSKFTVSTHDTVYTCTRQSAKAIRLERTKPTYYDYDTLDKQ